MNQSELIKKLNQAKKIIDECLIFSSKKTKFKKDKKIGSTQFSKKQNFDFTLNHRAFFKDYLNKKMNGQKKFTLIVAYLAKGKLNVEINKSEVENLWNNKVKVFMEGKCKGVYGTRAKDNKYLDSPKFGSYILLKNWIKIFN